MKFVRKLLNKIGLDFHVQTLKAKTEANKHQMKYLNSEHKIESQNQHIEYLYNEINTLTKGNYQDIKFYNDPKMKFHNHRNEIMFVDMSLEPIFFRFTINRNVVPTLHLPELSKYHCENLKNSVVEFIDTRLEPEIVKRLMSV